jgi:ATP-dependent Clp protease ATP-binding subunit ClpB
VFKPLGQTELRRILDLELKQIQQRIYQSSGDLPFTFAVTESGKNFLLSQGIDVKYGARHLKRALERLLVQPLSNLIATDQVGSGDWIDVDFDSDRNCLVFASEERSTLTTGYSGPGFPLPVPMNTSRHTSTSNI